MKKLVVAIAVITLMSTTVIRAADDKALAALQKIGTEYKDFKVTDSSTANVRPESFSLRVDGGLLGFTKYSGRYAGTVRLSEQEAHQSTVLLEKYVTEALQTKINANSPWQLLVKCNENTGLKMTGGAVWLGIPSVDSDKDMEERGAVVGAGASFQPVVTGSLFLLNTNEKLLVFQKDVYAAGSDMDSALRGFAETVDREYLAWSKMKQ